MFKPPVCMKSLDHHCSQEQRSPRVDADKERLAFLKEEPAHESRPSTSRSENLAGPGQHGGRTAEEKLPNLTPSGNHVKKKLESENKTNSKVKTKCCAKSEKRISQLKMWTKQPCVNEPWAGEKGYRKSSPGSADFFVHWLTLIPLIPLLFFFLTDTNRIEPTSIKNAHLLQEVAPLGILQPRNATWFTENNRYSQSSNFFPPHRIPRV